VCILNRSRTQTTGCSFCSSMSFHDDDDAKCQRSTTCYVSSVCRLPVHTTTTWYRIYFYQQRRLDGGSHLHHPHSTKNFRAAGVPEGTVVQKVTVLCLASWDLRAYMRSAIQVFTPDAQYERGHNPLCTNKKQNVRGITR
jgi:hypothetical protein